MSSGAAGGSGSEADDLQSRLASSNGALQSLLRRLSNGMEDLLPNSHGRARMKELLAMLKNHDEEGGQMEALTELCEVLSMGQEEILIGFSVDSFLPILVEILNMEHRPEMMLLSCRAITHLLEVMPKAATKVAASGAVSIFCERLLTIEFIDVAEQSLLAMHKLSVEHPEPILQANGLSAALTFIDFFDINTQRTAIATAANLCRNISADAFPLVVDMIPNVTALLSSSDLRMVESACMCISRLVDSCQASEAQLDKIAAHGALVQFVRLLRPSEGEGRPFELSTGTYTQVVKTLANSCRGSPRIAVMLLEEGIVLVVHHIIKKEDEGPVRKEGGNNSLLTAVAVNRPMEQLLHTLMLANELLPPLEADERVTKFVEDISSGTHMRQDLFGQQGSPPLLREFSDRKPGLLVEYSQLLYPILVDISVTIVNEAMRITCLSAVAKLLMSLPVEKLYDVVDQSQLLGYLSGFISSATVPVAGLSLMIAEVILGKLPDDFAPHFAREGIVHEVGRICAKESAMPDPAMDALLDHARQMQESLMGPTSSAGKCAANDAMMSKAKEVSARLNKGEVEALVDLRALLPGGGNSLSSYQVLNSGLAESLVAWLLEAVPERLVAFIEILSGRHGGTQLVEDEAAAQPLRTLVIKLNEALSMREAFPVAISDASGDLTAGLKLLAQPLKLRLTRDQNETSIGDYGGNVVLIEPLATINAVHDFLWPKVCQSSAEVFQPNSMGSPEGSGGEERRASSHGGDMTPPQGEMGIMDDETGDEDEDDDDDEEGDGEEEDVADITRPTPSRPAPGVPAGAGPATANAAKRHNLVFVVNGKPLSYKCPIIQAIGALGGQSGEAGGCRSAAAAGGAAGGQILACNRAWEQVHTVCYRTIRDGDGGCCSPTGHDMHGGCSVAKSGKDDDASADDAPALLSSVCALRNTLQEELVLKEACVSSETLLALSLLRALAVLNYSWSMLYDGHESVTFPRRTLVAAGEFINVKLAWKLMRQLQDPLMLCTGSLPAWCFDLTEKCGFLFPLECREYFTNCTAFGISRALHSMQQRVQGASASDRPTEVRIGRIQREKIRVSRAKILPSAMRALELYASHRSMLEVEYYGEAGTGLGPTLEFFTLVSQELQGARLGLWRDQGSLEDEDEDAGVADKADAGSKEAGAARRMDHLPNDGLGQAPAQAGYIRGFHRICVIRCTACTLIRFPRCQEHRTLMTRVTREGEGMCHRCDGAAAVRAIGGEHCKECGGTETMEWWMLSEEEAAYMHSAFPSGQASIDHILLQCPECKSVNFPGTEQCLVINRGGQMTSQSGRVMREQDYRAVTRHVTNSCSNLPLTQVAGRLTLEECQAAAQLIGTTPEAEELSDDLPAGTEGSRHVNAPHGLFPSPLPVTNREQVLEHFKFVGRLVGKGLLDQRHLDLPLSPAMLKVMVGCKLSFQDIGLVDPQLFKTLCKLKSALRLHEDDSSIPVQIDGCDIADLGLTMTVPGYESIELCPGGADVDVTTANLDKYIEGVTEQVIGSGVAQQLESFRAGFNEVFPMRHLEVYTAEELVLHIRGDVEAWDLDTLRASLHADHGFTDSSMPIIWLINVMTSMDKAQRRLFMRFVTGSPTIPAGGLRRLKPRLTVVRKEAEAPLTADDYLPSVMTCANYLKLPDYSSEEVLRRQLFTAMQEGQLSFLLS